MTNKKPRIASLMAVLIVVGLIVSPVCAENEYSLTNNFFLFKSTQNIDQYGVTDIDHNALNNKMRISLVKFRIPKDSKVDFTIYYGNDSTVSGYIENRPINALQNTETYSIGSDTQSYTFWDAEYEDVALAGYAKTNNETPETGFLVYSNEYGALDNSLAVFHPVPNISRNTIYRITATGTKPFDVMITDGTPQDVAGDSSKTILDISWDWINFGIEVSVFVLGFVISIFVWIKFLFIDNLLLIVALYISVSMAYSAMMCRGDVFRFYRSFFKFQRSFMNFIIELWNYFIAIISSFIGIFRI